MNAVECLLQRRVLDRLRSAGLRLYYKDPGTREFIARELSECGLEPPGSEAEWRRLWRRLIEASRRPQRRGGGGGVTPVVAVYSVLPRGEAPSILYESLEPLIVEALRGRARAAALFLPLGILPLEESLKVVASIASTPAGRAICDARVRALVCTHSHALSLEDAGRCGDYLASLCRGASR